MRCPECGVEMRVSQRTQTTRQAMQLHFTCRNRQCPNLGKKTAEKTIELTQEETK